MGGITRNSLISVLIIWMVIIDVSISKVECSIEVQFTIIPFRSAATLATDTVDVNGRDLSEEFLVIVNMIPLTTSIARGDISETSLVLESVSDWSAVMFHSMKLRLVLHMKCRFSPGQTDTAPRFDCVSSKGLNSIIKFRD